MTSKESDETLFRQAEKVMLLAKELAEQVAGIDTGYEGDFDSWCEAGGGYKFIAGVFLYSAMDDFKAILLLLRQELLNGAFLILRRLFELSVDLRFIGKCPGIRAKEFLLFERIQQEMYLQLLEKDSPRRLEVDEDQRKAIRKAYNEAMEALGRKKMPSQWSRYNWKDKCIHIDRGSMKVIWKRYYNTIYKLCCMYTHPTVRGLASFLKSPSDSRLVYEQPSDLLHIVHAFAITGFLDIIMNVNRVLGAGMDKVIAQTWRDLEDRGWTRL